MEHFGLEEMVKEIYEDKKKSNREIKTGLGCDYTPSHEFERNRVI